MNIGEIETNLEQIEVDIEKTEKRKKELESRESNIKNAIAQLEHDIQISEKIEKIVLEIHDEKQIVDNIMFSFKNRIKEISKKLSDMYKDTLEEINVLNKLDVLGEDVADSMSVLEERMNFVFESQNHLYELSECYGLNDILDYDDLKEEVEMIGEFIEPQRKKNHLPSENSGNFLGEKGNSIFIPNDNNILDILHSYGVNGIEYKNEEPDFSPFATQLTMWGEINTTVEIAHMTENRENGKWEFGRRPNGKKFDKNYEIGNFAQADYEMCEKIKAKNANLKLDPKDIEKFRKENKLTWHECKDGKTMMLIPEEIHKRFPHSGGVSEMSYRMEWGDIDLFN